MSTSRFGGVALAIALVIVLTSSVTPLAAQRAGVLLGEILDENGEPIADVSVTVTDPANQALRLVEQSDRRGRFSIRIRDTGPAYKVVLEKEGYQTTTYQDVNVDAGDRTRREFTMSSTAAVVQEAGAEEAEAATAALKEAVRAYNMQDWDTAIEQLESVVEMRPDLGEAQLLLALSHSQAGNHEAAIPPAQAALEAEASFGDIGSDDMYRILFDAYTALGREEEAQDALANMQEGDPSGAATSLFNKAVEAYNGGDLETAKAGFEQVFAVDPDHAKSHYMMGLIYVSEDPAKARTHLERFLELTPDDPEAQTAREMLQYLE